MTAAAVYEPDGAQLRAFQASTAFARGLIGPVYAGRKVTCLHEIMRRATARVYARQRIWCWLVLGPTRDEQERQVVVAAKQWLPEAAEYDPKTRVIGLEYQLGDGVLRALEVHFIALDVEAERKRRLTIEATGVWLEDARWLPEAVFDEALRIAGRGYPSPLHGGTLWSGVICSSRMPTPGHWLITRSIALEETPEHEKKAADLELFRQPGGRSERAENLKALRAKKFSSTWPNAGRPTGCASKSTPSSAPAPAKPPWKSIARRRGRILPGLSAW